MEELVELNRVTSNFASTMRERGQQIEGTLRSFAAAVDAAAGRLAAAAGSGAAAAPAPAPALPAPQLVRVVNDRGAPVPVVLVQDLVTQAARQEAPKTFWDRVLDFVTVGLPSTIAGFAGGFVGEVVMGIAKPWVGLAAGAELITIMIQVSGLVRELGSTAEAILQAVRDVVDRLFDRLERAGVFPVDKLRDTLLSLLELGLGLVDAQVRPILDRVGQLLVALGGWIGRFFEELGVWLGRVGNTLARFVTVFLDHLFAAVIRPGFHRILIDAVTGLTAVALGLLHGLGAILLEGAKQIGRWIVEGATFLGRWITEAGTYVARLIVEAGRHVGEWIAYAIMSAIERVARRLGLWPGVIPPPSPPPPFAPPSFTPPSFAPPPPFEPGKVAERAFAESRAAARTLSEALLGPPPAAPGAAPRLRLPGFTPPALELPAPPAAGTEPAPAPKAAAPRPATAPVTLNGGVNVQITAETIDLDNAEETARRIAGHLLEELERLSELQRFRRGLPTEALA